MAMVISQGEPYFCSSLVHDVLESNLKDFKLDRTGNIVSMGNLDKGVVSKNETDLRRAYELGVNLAIRAGFA